MLNGIFLRSFVLGGILLVGPLLIIAWQGDVCATRTVTCLGIADNKIFDTIFPYLMVAGGLFIGFGMKRFADAQREETESETQAEA